uniref:Xaa-Pro aminopeptidase 2 n=1 Tax=Chrysemys picta bellii TaxID=8478 RepID=A0A8C3P2Y9_CHRPI
MRGPGCVRDAVAVIQYLLWLEKNVPKGLVDEFSGARYVDKLRRSVQAAGAALHSGRGTGSALCRQGVPGSQGHGPASGDAYDFSFCCRDGTTDITRTVHWGEPTPFQKVLSMPICGPLALGLRLGPRHLVEAFARRALWEVGLNYGHGTGHGIGNFLSVHECRCSAGCLSPRETPGYYQEGEFGIRIEDVALVVEAQTKAYLTFEVVSLVPYDRNLINISFLSEDQYLNTYYETIRQRVGPELQRRQLEEEYEWLRRNTQPFSRGTLVAASLGTLAITSLVSTLLPDRQA